MSICILFLTGAMASSFAPSPGSVSGQISEASVVGEYVVTAATTVVLEDRIPVTHVVLRPLTPVKGDVAVPILILPGGVVDGRFRRVVPDGFQVIEGDTLFLMMSPAIEMPGYYNMAYSFRVAVFRQLETSRGTLMTDSDGRVVADIACDTRPTYAVREVTPSRDVDLDEEVSEIAGAFFLNVIVDDDPVSLGIPWAEGVRALAACGGAP